MIQIKQGVAYLLPVRLLDATNNPVTGVTYNQVTATAYYNDGSSAVVSPSAPDWTELAYGAYQLTLTPPNKPGPLQMIVIVSGANPFAGVYDLVADLDSDVIATLGTPHGASISADIGAASSQTGTIGGDTNYIYNHIGGGGGAPPIPIAFGGTFKGSSSPTVYVQLVTSAGVPVTGLTGSSSGLTAAAVSPAGVESSLSLPGNFTEVTGTVPFTGAGVYQLSGVVPTTSEGQWTIIVAYTTAVNYVTTYIVSNELWDDIYSRIGAPHGASIAADIGAASSSTGTIGGDTDFIITTIGSPAFSTVSGDIAAVYSRIGAPHGASIAADIGAASSHTGTIGGDTAYLYTNVGTILTDVGTINTNIGTPTIGSPMTLSGGQALIYSAITGGGATPPVPMTFSGTFKTSSTPEVFVKLVTSASVPVTGLTGSSSGLTAAAVSPTGSITSITLTGAFTEVTGTAPFTGSGIYQLTLPSSVTGSEGQWTFIVHYTTAVDYASTYIVSNELWDDIYSRLGAPSGASIAADIGAASSQTGTIGGDTAAIYTLAAAGATASALSTVQTDVSAIQTSVGSNLGTNVSAIETSVGSNLGTNVTAIYTRIGAPSGASIAADIGAGASHTGSIGGDTAYIYTHVGSGGAEPVPVTFSGTFVASSTPLILVRLVDSSGAPVAGVTAPLISAVDPTGSATSSVGGTTFTEITTGNFASQGIYQLGLPAGVTNVEGQWTILVQYPGSGSMFVEYVTTYLISNYLWDDVIASTGVYGGTTIQSYLSTNATNVGTILTDIGTSPGGTYGTIFANLVAIRKIETNRWKIFTTGPNVNKMIIYDDDGTTPLFTLNLFDSSGTPTFVNPYERSP